MFTLKNIKYRITHIKKDKTNKQKKVQIYICICFKKGFNGKMFDLKMLYRVILNTYTHAKVS